MVAHFNSNATPYDIFKELIACNLRNGTNTLERYQEQSRLPHPDIDLINKKIPDLEVSLARVKRVSDGLDRLELEEKRALNASLLRDSQDKRSLQFIEPDALRSRFGVPNFTAVRGEEED